MGQFTFDPDGAVIPVRGELIGRVSQIVTLLVDTGASYVMIPWRIAEALGKDPAAARERVNIMTASGMERAPLIDLDAIRVAGENARSVPTLIHDLPPQSRVDGLLGLSFLKHFTITIDFQRGIFELN